MCLNKEEKRLTCGSLEDILPNVWWNLSVPVNPLFWRKLWLYNVQNVYISNG